MGIAFIAANLMLFSKGQNQELDKTCKKKTSRNAGGFKYIQVIIFLVDS